MAEAIQEAERTIKISGDKVIFGAESVSFGQFQNLYFIAIFLNTCIITELLSLQKSRLRLSLRDDARKGIFKSV